MSPLYELGRHRLTDQDSGVDFSHLNFSSAIGLGGGSLDAKKPCDCFSFFSFPPVGKFVPGRGGDSRAAVPPVVRSSPSGVGLGPRLRGSTPSYDSKVSGEDCERRYIRTRGRGYDGIRPSAEGETRPSCSPSVSCDSVGRPALNAEA